MVIVIKVVSVDVAVSVTLSKVEAGTIDVILKTGAVDKDVEVTVRFDGLTVLVTHVVEVVIDKYELQKEVADDASSTAATSLTARQSTSEVGADDGSDDLEVVTDDAITDKEADELVETDDLADDVPEEVFEIMLALVLEVGSLALLTEDDTLELDL